MKSYMILLFFMGSLIHVLAQLPNCPIYLTKTIDDGKCSSYEVNDTKTILYLKKCPKDKYCHYKFPLKSNVESCSDKSLKQYTGNYCDSKTECLYGTCKDSVCKTDNNICEIDFECNPGYYCRENKCEELINRTHSCDSLNPCKVNLVCANGQCVKYGSIENKHNSTAPAACKSFYTIGGKCQKGPELNNPNNGNKCPKSGVCSYTLGNNNNHQEPCKCGVNDKGLSYCSPGIGGLDPTPVCYFITLVF